MKITSVECYLGQFITMKINTDEGIYGWGSLLPCCFGAVRLSPFPPDGGKGDFFA